MATPIPPRLPRCEEAEIEQAKLTEYALNADHEAQGRDKARVFRSALGIERGDWEYLRDAILRSICATEVQRIDRSRYGFRYAVSNIEVEGLNGKTAPVATRWMVEGDRPPRLSTTWVDV